MGGGASKKKAQPQEQSENPSTPGTTAPTPKKPEAAREAKRPRPVKGKAKLDTKDEDDAEAASGPDAPPASPLMPSATVETQQVSVPAVVTAAAAQDDVEEAEARAIEKFSAAPKAASSSLEAPAAAPLQRVKSDISGADFLEACGSGDAATVQAFLVAKARSAKGLADQQEVLFDAYGDSVMHHAALGGTAEVIQMLLELGKLEADIPNARNETPLQLASRRSEAAIVATLLQAGANPERRDSAGLSSFLAAIFGGADEEVTDMLLKAGADPSAQDSRGVSALHFAAIRGDIKLMHWLLRNGIECDLQTEHGTTALMLASKRGSLDATLILLACRANPNLADEAGGTALMHALSGSHAEVAMKILEAGASVDTVDCAGRSALFHAVLGLEQDAITAVITRGGRVNILDEEGRSPLYQACLMGTKETVKLLLDAGGDPNLAGRGSTVRPAQCHGGEDRENDAARACLEEARTCLQVCATLGHNDILLTLLEHGADVNAGPGGLGWTSLHLCAALSNEEGLSLLLQHGADASIPDAEGNVAEVLAERAGRTAAVEALRTAVTTDEDEGGTAEGHSSSKPKSPARRAVVRGQLPPLHALPEPDPPSEELEPLETYAESWVTRSSDGSLLDSVLSPMVHDAFKSDNWRDRWEALTYTQKHFGEVAGQAVDRVGAICEVLTIASKDKMPKVFLAAVSLLDELLCDPAVDELSPEEFSSLLRGASSGKANANILVLLLGQTDTGSSSSAAAASPQQAASDALCSCILHGRVPLDEVAHLLMTRIADRLREDAKDRREASRLATNLKLLGRLLTAFGLQRSGLFRRALLLPLLLLSAASESSKVRGAGGDAMIQLMSLSGGLEERLWSLIPAKARKALQKQAQAHEGVVLMSAVPCVEDAAPRHDLVAEDTRAGGFVCVSELNVQVFAALLKGDEAVSASLASKAGASSSSAAGGAAVADDNAAEALSKALISKNWKDRADALERLASDLATGSDGMHVLEDCESSGNGSFGPMLAQYVLGGHRISTLQAQLGIAVADSVTAVFVAAADLLRLLCGHVPLYIAPLLLEPLLPALVARLLDTSNKVRAKAVETTLEVAMLHGCALSEMIAQSVASGSAWNTAAPATSGGEKSGAGGKDCDRSTEARLKLLVQLVQQLQKQDASEKFTDGTWQALADYAMKAAEHRSGDVRKEAAAVLNSLTATGGRAGEVAEAAIAQLQAIAQQKIAKRPGTSSTRPTTGSTRLGTAAGASRPGTGMLNASGKLSNLGSTGGMSGFSLTMGSTGRLSTGKSRTSTSSGFRPGTGKHRPTTGLIRERDMNEESDNSIHSDEEAGDGHTDEGGVQFFDVKTCCPGADEVPELAQGEAALREALPLAEALDEVALDFVAPLVALFGDGWTRCFYSRNWQCRVAALTHLAASMNQRLQDFRGEFASERLGDLLDGTMRAVHEGLGDQNVRVYEEACLAVVAVVPVFCSAVDGRLLVAHLAPLLRQLCSRMGDSKETVRAQTTQVLFRLLRPPTGSIVSPVAIAMLILRHLTPGKEGVEQGDTSPVKGPSKGAPVGWLCRIETLRCLIKEHSSLMMQQTTSTEPGEWIRIADGLTHSDPTVRHEAARLYALVCKLHLKRVQGEEAQRQGREAWVDALPKDVPSKTLLQVRKLLKLPEHCEVENVATPGKALLRSNVPLLPPWEVPASLAAWAGCSPEVLAPLSMPAKGEEKAIINALKALGKAAISHDKAALRGGARPDEAFAGICRAIQQALATAVGNDRHVFLCAVELCQHAVDKLAPGLSGLDINMGLSKTFPTLMERTTIAGIAGDVKVGVASDKLVQMLAKHPKVGCEAVTKMVIGAVARGQRPIRPLTLLRTLLSDFGLRLCAQKDHVTLLLNAVAIQLERLTSEKFAGQVEDADALRPQLVGVLATCNQFSPETVHYCMSEVEPSYKKLLLAALAEAPNPRLFALGATAAEQDSTHMAGSAVRVASRSRGLSPKPSPDGRSESPQSPPRRRDGLTGRSGSRSQLPRPEDLGSSKSKDLDPLASPPALREASPKSHDKKRRPRRGNSDSIGEAQGGISEASTAASTSTDYPNESPRHPATQLKFPGESLPRPGRLSSLEGLGASSGARPPAPMGLSTALSGSSSWKFSEDGASSKPLQRVGSSEGRFLKTKEKSANDSLGAIMDVLSQMDGGRKTR